MSGRATTLRRQARLGLIASLAALAAIAGACEQPQGPPVVSANPLADSAEQIMYGLRATLRNMGVNRGNLLSDSAFIFDNQTRYELFSVETDFFDERTGAPTGKLTSLRGTYSTLYNTMQARGDVVVVSTDGKRLTTPELNYSETENLLRSDSAFVMLLPDGKRVEGVGFTSDPDLNVVNIVSLRSGTGGAVSVPDR